MKFNYITPENMAKFKKLAQGAYRKWAVDEFDLKADLLDAGLNEVARIQKELGTTYLNRYGR